MSSEAGESALPEAVRQRVVSLAAEVLGALPSAQVPTTLKRVAQFTPARRARMGATQIATALAQDAAFRHAVGERVRTDAPELTESLTGGIVPAAADPVDVATVAYLTRPSGWQSYVDAARAELLAVAERAEAVRESAELVRLREQLDQARQDQRADRERLKADIDRLKEESAGLRRRLADARTRAHLADQAAAAADGAVAAVRGRADSDRSSFEAEIRRLRTRLAEAEAAAEANRRAGREGRSLDEIRTRLLIDTLTEAAAGLRRELALPPGDARPADSAGGREPGVGGADTAARAQEADDPAMLDALLALPRAHLVVDGYNVTKLAWPALPLESQRSRLVSALAPVGGRTGAEITVVFDGADLPVVPPVPTPRAVRVRFSEPQMSADELIRRLVRAEPAGRPVVVISSDREVADGVRRPGVRPLPAEALVRLLTR